MAPATPAPQAAPQTSQPTAAPADDDDDMPF
jgi:hypothetical protein